MTKLSQRRAADRLAMADRVSQLAAKHGFTITVRPGPLNDRELWVCIHAARGLRCSMDFSPEAEGPRGWGFIGHWHTEHTSASRLRLGFSVHCGGSVNEFHRRKATTFADDFEQFVAILDRALAVVASGEAFEESSDDLAA